ncbi:hypothetical protein ACWC9R_28615 [Streptomyces sp. NPDC001219]
MTARPDPPTARGPEDHAAVPPQLPISPYSEHPASCDLLAGGGLL